MAGSTLISVRPSDGGVFRLRGYGSFMLLDLDGRDLTPRGHKARAIIAYLAEHAGDRIPRERMIELLWGDRGDEQARASLRQSLHEIRTSVAAQLIESHRDHLWIDRSRIETVANDETDPSGATELYGDLNHVTPQFDEWLSSIRETRAGEAWAELRAEAERLLAEGRGAEARAVCEQMERIDPFNEDWVRLAMQAEFQEAHPAAIEELYRDIAERLDEELGISPASQTKALRDRLIGELAAEALAEDSPVAKDLRSYHRSPPLLALSRRHAIVGGAGVAAIAAAGGGWWLLQPAAASAGRIAVMPFDNLSGDPGQTYFAEGVAEELRGALTRIGLQVIGRASSEAVRNLDTKIAARKLRVANILTGSIQRTPSIIRISAQLIGGSDGVQRWSQNYDRAPGDTIAIETDIAANVVQALSLALGQAGRAALMLGGTRDPGAQDLYLRARELKYNFGDEDSLGRSVRLLDAAIARDQNYAEAYALKATELEILGSNYARSTSDMVDKLARAEIAARRAIAIAPGFAAPYVPLALVEADRLNFDVSLSNMRRALALAPENLSVISNASSFDQWFGGGRKALELADRVIALDPLQASNYSRRGSVLLFALRRYPEAIETFRKALEFAPKLSSPHNYIGDCLLLMGHFEAAAAEFAKVPADDPARLAGEAMLAMRSGNSDGAELIVAKMRALFGDAASFQYAEIYAQGGDPDRAFAELDKAVRTKDPGLIQLKSEPFLDPIIRDPRYAALLRRLSFPTWM
jgi:TolB-like protein/DNA-binding SARP family transcriptional activator